MVKKMTERAKCAMMRDGEMSKYYAILRGFAQEFTLSPTLFKVYVNDLILVIESAQL